MSAINEILLNLIPSDLINDVMSYDAHTCCMKEIEKGVQLKFNPMMRRLETGNVYYVYSNEGIYYSFDDDIYRAMMTGFGCFNPWRKDIQFRCLDYKMFWKLGYISEDEYKAICKESCIRLL